MKRGFKYTRRVVRWQRRLGGRRLAPKQVNGSRRGISCADHCGHPLWGRNEVSSKWLSPRPISTAKLHTLLRFHMRPIKLVVFQWPYLVNRVGGLILGGASCLDAFSAYPVQTWLPSGASGETTGTPAVCPSRSSRTRESFPQTSYAHGG